MEKGQTLHQADQGTGAVVVSSPSGGMLYPQPHLPSSDPCGEKKCIHEVVP